MKYKLGDFVRFVDENMEGYVTRIIDDHMIGVTGADDFEIPVPASKVTYVYGHNISIDDKHNKPLAPIATENFIEKGIYLAVVPDQKTAAVVHFHLVNTTSYQILITLSTLQNLQYKGEYAGIVMPQSVEKVYAAPLADLQIWPQFNLQLLYYTQQNKKPVEPLIITERFKAKDFAGSKKQVPLMNQQGWLIRLDEDDLVIDAEKLKESFFKPAEEKQLVDKPATEVDLHIEKLKHEHQLLNSATILNIQLDHFKKALDAAIVHQLPEITFIHGAGNGTLKHELHKLLSKNNRIQTFMDARKEKFGYGATKVILK
ncbi:Smr/MutS family protein [Mucilaginibacter boryungensis]|uniref:Smr/MutS family protein n=1 Tax=Mucilaginibacter boryungensis TaxID=768480 RepID=A0ABR9XF74_9SPHI|nr:Smr/MutS family protein [Mucilaginibacter boryungensis]MBE9666038.1 Smr/MutS family protein [Mucilaginibacter boryungensis]